MAAVVMTFVIFVFAEVVPKTYAVQRHGARRSGAGAAGVPPRDGCCSPLSQRADPGSPTPSMILLPGRGLAEGTVRDGGGDPPPRRRRRGRGGDRRGGARADPFGLRVRRHGGARGDGAPARHGRVYRPTRRWTKPSRRSSRPATRASPSTRATPTTSSACSTRRTSSSGRTKEAPTSQGARRLGRAPLFVPEQKKVAELLREMQSSTSTWRSSSTSTAARPGW